MRESMTSLITLDAQRRYFRTAMGRGLCMGMFETLFFEAMELAVLDQYDEDPATEGEGFLGRIMNRWPLPSSLIEFDLPENAPTSAYTSRKTWEKGTRYGVDMQSSGLQMQSFMNDTLSRCEPWWTHPDMARVVDVAAQEIDPDHTIEAYHLPMPWGYVHLGTPVWYRQEIGEGREALDVRLDSVTWAVRGRAVYLTGWSAAHGSKDHVGEAIAEQIPPASLPNMIPLKFSRIDFGRPLPDEALARYMAAWWHLIEQPIAARQRQTANKVETKRDKRLKGTGDVTEVRLRTQKIHRLDHAESSVEWNQRWLVRGHWRKQPYKGGRIERIYIAPYVKGPADKPLVITQKIYRWDR